MEAEGTQMCTPKVKRVLRNVLGRNSDKFWIWYK